MVVKSSLAKMLARIGSIPNFFKKKAFIPALQHLLASLG